VHEGLEVYDIASSGLASSAVNGTLFYPAFAEEIRDPIRAHLEAEDLVYQIRSLVLCKGLPHRIDDPDNPGVGDSPSQFAGLWSGGGAISASVDSELVLLWQSLDEANIDPFRTADVTYIRSPYWRRARPINTWTNNNIRGEKSWDFVTVGNALTTVGDDPAARLTPGDMILVTRLDGHTVEDVRAMVERAGSIVYDVDDSAFVLDESGSNGIADPQPNSELDNVQDPVSRDDDYETARDVLLADGRFDPANVRYDPASGASNFSVGPNVDFGGQGMLIADPLVLLTHYGRNHAGEPGQNAGMYEESFILAPGAMFNTMESYNGRALNGLGTRFGQAQLADFIGAGGTFGIGMVWEPLAQTVPDSNRLVRTFALGRLTWAEAAYTAIPALSWMHVVLGDPLARAIASSEDIDGDGDLDVDDLHAWERAPVDLNRDGMADDADRRLLTETLRGAIQQTFDAGRGRR
jgi:hypothetical protein